MSHIPVDVFVARQPIFDRERRVTGYELLYRSSAANRFEGAPPETATSMNLEHALLSFGLRTITGDRDAWINASRGTLVHDHWTMLPAAQTVIELLETVDPSPDVVAACRRLRDAGYQLALDDFVERPDYAPLLDLAHYVKIDFRAHEPRARRKLGRVLRQRGLQLLAEKIETHEELLEARDEDYALFQGYFFCRPEMMHTRELAPNRVGYLRLLRHVHEPALDFPAVEAIIARDVALSLKLLRFLHSAAFGFTRDVSSIRQAMLLLGETALRKWAALVAVFGLAKGKPTELIVVALARARFAEQLAGPAGMPERSLDLFLTGLLSVVDALTDRPMSEALGAVAVSDDVRGALLEGAPPLGDVLGLVLAWERGDWDAAGGMLRDRGLDEGEVSGIYADSVLWAEDHAQP